MNNANRTQHEMGSEVQQLKDRVAELEAICSESGDRPASVEAAGEALDILNGSAMVAIIWRNEAGWPVEYVTDNVEAVLGHKASELLSGKVKYDQIIYPDDLPRVTREVVLYSGQADCQNFVHVPYRILTPDGDLRWIEDRTDLRRDKTGTITHYRGIISDISERIRLEQALRDSEERLSMALSGANEGIWDWDLAADNLYFDACYYRMAGYEPDEFPATFGEWKKRIHPDDLAQAMVALDGYLDGERETYENEFRFLCRDGTYMWILARGKIVAWDAAGNRARFVGTHMDISERKQMEKALKKSESQLSEAQKLAGLGYWEWNIRSGEVIWSDEVYRIFQLDPATFTPQIDSVMQLSPWPEYRDRHLELVQRVSDASAEDGKGSYDQKFLRPDDSIGYYHSTFKGDFDSDGTLVAMQGTVMDITERKVAESELQNLRNYLSNIINSMPSSLVAVDEAGNVTLWNSQTELETGLPSEQARGKPLSTVWPALANEMDRIRTSIRERRAIRFSRSSSGAENEVRHAAITIYPLIVNGVDGAVIRVDDVTEQVRMEELIVQNEKMLSVGGLAAGMAHEINNPLAGILQTAGVMKSRLSDLDIPSNISASQRAGVSPEKIKAYMEDRGILRMLDNIEGSGKWMASIIENMLNFARKSEDGVSLHALETLLDRTAELAATDYDLAKKYDFKKIQILREYAPEESVVPCEGSSIQQVLLNILSNGAHAMLEAGTPEPRFIFRTRTDLAANVAIMEIEDNGPGIDEEIQSRIFEPFYTTKPVGIGTGLGLSVSYFIVTETHHGTLSVDSSPGSGAKFTIQLPMARS